MTSAGRIVLTGVVWLLWGLLVIAWTPILFLVFLATAWWDRRRQVVGRAFRVLARFAVFLNPLWSVRFHGRLPRDRTVPYVVVCNHQSMADPVLVGSLPWETKWIAKEAVFRIPFLAQMMWMAGDVKVCRHDEESRGRAYDRLREWIERGASVMIFPEGTRSPTGELLPFRNGAFRLAIETGAPILPLAVSGTREALRKGSLLFGRARADVVILDPVPVDGYGMERVEELRELVRDRIDRARRRSPSFGTSETPPPAEAP